MIKKSVGFERASDVQAIVYSVNDGSAVFVVPNGFVVLEVPLSQTQAEYFKMYEKSPKEVKAQLSLKSPNTSGAL